MGVESNAAKYIFGLKIPAFDLVIMGCPSGWGKWRLCGKEGDLGRALFSEVLFVGDECSDWLENETTGKSTRESECDTCDEEEAKRLLVEEGAKKACIIEDEVSVVEWEDEVDWEEQDSWIEEKSTPSW